MTAPEDGKNVEKITSRLVGQLQMWSPIRDVVDLPVGARLRLYIYNF